MKTCLQESQEPRVTLLTPGPRLITDVVLSLSAQRRPTTHGARFTVSVATQ
jgi:hypothetical protein